MKILLAEDDAVSSLLMRRTLQTFGYEVVLAQNGRMAAEILAQPDAPRLALVDWMMPELDGLSLCREVRRHQVEGSYIYIVLLTSKQDSEDIVAGLEAGADDYLTKPCQSAELRARLRTGQRILSLEEKLVQAREEMRHKATHDGLTGIWNRAAILSLTNSELLRSSRRKSPFSVLLCDVDHFKRVNDEYGHLAGDLVLQEISRRLSSAVRGYDAVGRYGGEEFLILLNDCEESVLQARANEIRSLISTSPVSADHVALFVTMSVGAATFDPEEGAPTIEQLLARADAALYQAKRDGRNCVVLADRPVLR
jgi:two-component system, cell cycle response regulator